jgi:hypothetical protein
MAPQASKQAAEKPFRHSNASMACTPGTRGEHPCRMLKKVRLLTRPTLARRDAPYPMQGRSERRGDAYSVRYGGPLSEARTPLADFFSIQLSAVFYLPITIRIASCTRNGIDSEKVPGSFSVLHCWREVATKPSEWHPLLFRARGDQGNCCHESQWPVDREASLMLSIRLSSHC